MMLYNGSVHASLGVTPNSLKFWHEVPSPGEILLGRPPLGPDDGPPGALEDRLHREMQVLVRAADDQQKLAIDRNTKFYSGLTQHFLPGDLVFAFTERKGDPTPHRKLKLKWAGPFIFISQVNQAMVEIGTMQSRQHLARWKRDTILIHRSKLRLYQRRTTHPREERPYQDPADLPQFDASDRNQIQVEMIDHFSDVETVRREHVEPRRGDQAALADMQGGPEPFERGGSDPRPPLTQWKRSFPPNPEPPLVVMPHKGEDPTPH